MYPRLPSDGSAPPFRYPHKLCRRQPLFLQIFTDVRSNLQPRILWPVCHNNIMFAAPYTHVHVTPVSLPFPVLRAPVPQFHQRFSSRPHPLKARFFSACISDSFRSASCSVRESTSSGRLSFFLQINQILNISFRPFHRRVR